MKLQTIVLIMILISAITLATTLESNVACSPWKGRCYTSEDCCRDLVCLTYRAICVPKEGITIPGEDNRPTGVGPFPPNSSNT